MFATYEVLTDRIVLEYHGWHGEWHGCERVDIPRRCVDTQALAYQAASQRAACKGLRLEALRKIP